MDWCSSSKHIQLYFRARPRVFFLVLKMSYPSNLKLTICLTDILNIEAGSNRIRNVQDAVDYLTWTLYYCRLLQNPNYYGLIGTSDRHLSDHLSDLVDTSLEELKEAECILVDEEGDI